jgi:hypothetical protein
VVVCQWVSARPQLTTEYFAQWRDSDSRLCDVPFGCRWRSVEASSCGRASGLTSWVDTHLRVSDGCLCVQILTQYFAQWRYLDTRF